MSGRAIEASERSGVLAPQNLARFRAQWFEPHPELSNIVDSYWSVRWQLNSEEVVRQPILAAPGVTLSFESAGSRAGCDFRRLRLLSAPDAPPSELAATLGYTDQAHLVNDFHRATGTTRGRT